MSQVLGLDVGTQGTKGLVLDLESGRVVARASSSYGLLPGLPVGAAEQDPATWWDAVRTVVAELRAQDAFHPERLRGIGVSGQQHGFVPLDARDEVIRPAKLWCDTSTAAEARELSERLGRPLPTGYTASKILWFSRHEPRNRARLARVLLPHDWIDLKLTGTAWMEAGDASGTGFFDPLERRFDERAMLAVDPELPELVPELVTPHEPAGTLSRGAAAELGLPAGVAVAPGGGDNMLSAIGSGAVVPGRWVLSLGTSATVFARADVPVVDPAGLVAPFCDSTGGWLPLLCVMNATGVIEEVRSAFALGHDELTALAEAEPAGCEGLLLLPYLAGERVPDLPRAAGTLLGIRAGSLTPGRLLRAALEGTSLNLGWGLDRMRALGLEPTSLRLVGGGARNALWRRILAAVAGTPVERLAEPESAALGAALQAAWVTTKEPIESLTARFVAVDGARVDPEPELVEVYRTLSARFRSEVERFYA